jgi:acetolactate synthase-1/2/3 large subunit
MLVQKAHEKVSAKCSVPVASTSKVTPDQFFQRVQMVFGPEAKFAVDSGNGLFLAMENLRLQNPRSFLSPTDYSCMGYCVPAAIGAKMANPNKPVVAFPGDGAFLMTGLELLTAVKQEIGLAVMVLCDGEYSQIKQFQQKTLVRTTLTELFSYDLKAIAEAIDAKYFVITHNDEIESVCRNILDLTQRNQTVLCEVRIDYSNPTYFTKGILKTNFGRLATYDKIRMTGRFLKRKIFD